MICMFSMYDMLCMYDMYDMLCLYDMDGMVWNVIENYRLFISSI